MKRMVNWGVVREMGDTASSVILKGESAYRKSAAIFTRLRLAREGGLPSGLKGKGIY